MFEDERTGDELGEWAPGSGQRVLLSTAPDEATAAKLARALVEARLVACVNLVPGARSIYRWEGKVEDATETLMIIKTTEASAPAVASLLRREHPSTCPELVAYDVTSGLGAYLAWMTAESSG